MEFERLPHTTADGVELTMEALYRIAPSCFTEAMGEDGKVHRVVDFKVLRQLLGDNAVDDADEMYQFTWPGKRQARYEAARPIDKTLRPVKEDSVDWDTTQNLYIEGDNLEVLKLLQKSYMDQVKMIYIDPPYNTGNDFVYNDDYSQSSSDFDAASGNVDDLGQRFRKNTDSNGRFHSDWCSMMYSRLSIARTLLSEDGVIFISMDDSEIENLTKICNEIFGEQNFVEVLKWKKKKQPSFLAKHTAKMMEYVLVYAKEWECLEKLSIEGTSDSTKKVINLSNPESERVFKIGVRVKGIVNGIIPAGAYTVRTMTVEYLSDVKVQNGRTIEEIRVKSKFSVSQDTLNKYMDEDLLFITAQKGLRRDVSNEELGSRKSITDLLLSDWGDNQESDREFLSLFPAKYFDFVKPINLIGNLVKCIDSQSKIRLMRKSPWLTLSQRSR
ncbi:MAG: site-specific DNA-methyltransferase, partial [Bacteroidales bacterium]|nr:site-specific DNA-methyltransferase [Bacteroidales bacterium]